VLHGCTSSAPWSCDNTIISIISSWWSGLLYLFSFSLWTLQYARQHLLGFMFRHGHYTDACMLFFPQNAVPPPPQPSAMGVATSSSSPQRLDPLATDYGNIDDLCDLCIGYGAMNVLEEVISTRIASAKQQDVNQHTAAVLARICTYCETHRHFNYLYQFQVNGTPFSLFTSFFFLLFKIKGASWASDYIWKGGSFTTVTFPVYEICSILSTQHF